MDINAAATQLERAELYGVGIEPLSAHPDGVSREAAWQIARERDDRRWRAGMSLSGYKLGWTSEAMRQAFGIQEPNYGTLWTPMLIRDILDISPLIHPKVEAEIAFRATVPISGANVTPDEVVSSGTWAVALEIVDPRWRTYQFTWEDNVADGSSAARYLVGEWSAADDPSECFVSFRSGDHLETATGDAAMGSPALAVSWLVRQLHVIGAGLQPGMVVLTGGLTAARDLHPDSEVVVESPELGSCRIQCTSSGAARLRTSLADGAGDFPAYGGADDEQPGRTQT
ncbi:2-keto-4-pentenoate hydratase [Nocardioides sp. LHG3406-4]|uniref:2-keto-4-pentenoate hydratase n=1 Tax=Nocardioides sp. LHG3406-4 TaxID=2804575 RepID=UPI003CEC1419